MGRLGWTLAGAGAWRVLGRLARGGKLAQIDAGIGSRLLVWAGACSGVLAGESCYRRLLVYPGCAVSGFGSEVERKHILQLEIFLVLSVFSLWQLTLDSR